MSTKFTPGPWKAGNHQTITGRGATYHGREEGTDGPVVYSSRNADIEPKPVILLCAPLAEAGCMKVVAHVIPEPDPFCSADTNGEANANLIASAPSMYEALEKAIPYIRRAYECAFPDASENQAILEEAEAALKLARGEGQ